jgi:hypothetical protein
MQRFELFTGVLGEEAIRVARQTSASSMREHISIIR